MTGPALLWLIAATAVFMVANAGLKLHVNGGSLWVLSGALALFIVGNLLMVQVMRGSGLGLAIAISVVFQMIAVTAMARFAFGEVLTPLQWSGIALGVVAVALIAWPQGGTG